MVLAGHTESILDTSMPTIENIKPFVAVGIPALNEEHAIAKVVLEAQKYADLVIVCDDGSTDMTAQIAERLGAMIIRHEENGGYGSALKSLFCKALEVGADVLVTLDGDGQHDSTEIPQVIEPIIKGQADVAIGSRFIAANGTKEMPLYRQVGAKIITKMVNGSSQSGLKDSQSGFRAYNRQALDKLCVSEAGMGASVQILLQASKSKLRITEVASTCKYNTEGSTSTKNPISHGIGVIGSITRLIIEEHPLKVLGIPSILFLFAGVFFGIWMLNIYAIEHQIITNIALASLGFMVIGFFTASSAITLYAISRVSKKISQKQ